jgi:tetratricopeptide (TPR) repeat protein
VTGEPANLDFEGDSEQGERPRNWGGGGQGYELLVDRFVSRTGGASGCIRSAGRLGSQGFGTLTKRLDADRFHGTLVRYSGFLKTTDVRGWAGLWMRVDGDADKKLRFDNMMHPVDRSVAGTTDWTQYEIVLDVPPEATAIYLGFLLSGTGTVWGDDLLLEILSASDDPGPLPPGAKVAPSLPRGLLPAWTSTVYANQPDDSRGEGVHGGSAAEELFFGRDDEQRQFGELLAELARTPKKAEPGCSHVVIVHGIGGIGKSTLAARFRRVAAEGDYRDRNTVVTIDWADVRQDPAFATQPGSSFQAVLDKLEQECSRTGRLARCFAQFRRLRLRVAQVNADVDRMGGQADSGQPDTAVGRSARMVGSVLQAGEVVGVPPGLGEAMQVAGMAADTASVLWKGGESWLRARLDPEDYQLYAHPQEVLASAFAKGLAAAAARGPIVLLLDTCEVVAAVGPWLRAVIRESGPRVAWVLCGRFEVDPAGWPGDLYGLDGYVPGGRLSELSAYRKEIPGSRLRLFELGAFDANTLRAYLTKAAPRRPADDEQLDRLLAATAGIPLAVRLAASLWERGIAIETISDPVPISTDRRTVVEGMTERFFLHFTGDGASRSDRDRIYGLALVLYPDDADLIAALWATDHVVETFELLAQRHDFVLTGQFRLHDTVHSFLLRYLLDPFHRRGVRPLNQRAVALLEQRLGTHHRHLPTLEQRMKNDRWIADLLALVWHRFWVDDQDGWATLLAAFPAAIAYNPGVGRALLDLAARFVPAAAADGRRRLRLLRDTVGPIAALFDRMGADSLSELGGSGLRASIEPDEDCDGERAAILEWLNGQRALHDNELAAALRHLIAAAGHVPPSARRLRRWIGRSLVDLSQRLAAEQRDSRPDPETAPFAVAAGMAVRLQPDDPDAQRQWGRVLYHLGRDQDALDAFQTTFELSDHGADAYIDHGEILRGLGRYEAALDAVNQAIGLEPDNARALGSRGETYRHLGRDDEAMTDLNDAISRDHELGWAFFSRGEIYLTRGDNEKALVDFKQAIDAHYDYGIAFVERGRAHYRMAHFEEALTSFGDAISVDPTDTRALAWRGQTYQAMARFEEALADLNTALGLTPGDAGVLAVRGETHRMMGQYAQAIADFDRAIELDLSSAWALASRGQAYQAMGWFEKALADLTEALRLDPELNWASTVRGETHQLMGRYEEALADLNTALGLAHDDIPTLAARGRTYRALGRYAEALADLDRAIEFDPGYAWVIAARGETYCRMGRHQEALVDLDKAVALSPDLDWAITVRGCNYAQMGQYAEALADLGRAAQLDPEYASPQFELALVYLRTGQRSPALAALGKAISIITDEIAAKGVTLPRLFDLALCHTALGDAEQSKAFLAQAQALPGAATYVRRTAIPELRRLQGVIPDLEQFDELFRLLAT